MSSQPAPAYPAALSMVPSPAASFRLHPRHRRLFASFAACVLLPILATSAYLWIFAADRYDSQLSFSVRSEESRSPVEFLGGIADLPGSGASDGEILYDFIRSQKLVADIDAALDLRRMWALPENDPVFAYHAPGTIEDLVDYWGRMVQVHHDTTARVIDIRVQAFRPQDAKAIAHEILEHSARMINALNHIAREDAVRNARKDLALSLDRLKTARQRVTRFRNRNQIVDPQTDIQSRMGLLGTLQMQLAESLIDHDMLTGTTRPGDARIEQAEHRVAVIEARIAAERRKLGLGDNNGDDSAFAEIVGEYERLAVDREFAEQSYVMAAAAHDAALASARRQSRYLTTHIAPTEAEASRSPRRVMILGLVSLFLALVWAFLALVLYSLRDRR